MKKYLLTIIIFFFSTPSFAENFSGKWVAIAHGHDVIINLKQNGSRVSGEMWETTHNLGDPKSKIDGRVNGRGIIFYRSMPGRKNFQEYKGYMFKGSQGMAGIFSHKNSWEYGWHARRRQF